MTELSWDGKYDKDGRKVAPLRIALPFQTVETVNESIQQRQRSLDVFSRAKEADWRNRVIWGDKKYVLPALAAEFTGKVDLIYIDPPFATGDDFSMPIDVNGSEFDHSPTLIEQKAYRDTWGVSAEERRRGVTKLDRYLAWFYETVALLYPLMAETATLYVHLDWRVGHYAKVVLDEVFGQDNLLNEVIWWYRKWSKSTNHFLRNHDNIYVYAKSPRHTFNVLRVPLSPSTITRFGGKRQDFADEDRTRKITGEEESEGGFRPDVWTQNAIPAHAHEKLGYPTQKPRALLKTVIEASSNPGDLVLDCFCGSGTTAEAAELLGRRWIACDLSRFAVHMTRKRLLSVPELAPFVVQNLGKYERQVWQKSEFGAKADARTQAYRRFILELYKAKPIEGYIWLHGLKDGRMVHVGTVDAPVTAGDVKQIASEFAHTVGHGEASPTTKAVDVLGWDFAFELNEVARQTAGRAGIDMRFWRIPREVLDKRAVEQGDVRFFELAALSVDVEQRRHKLTIALTNFMIPLDDVPEDVQSAIMDWSQWIDYWAVDWDNKGDTFHNEWQTYRTRKEPVLHKAASHEYAAASTYRVVVKVIDILGNDTTKTLTVEVS